jgi:hypothetical protein
VQFDAESDEELTEHKVRQVNTTSTSPIQELQLKYDAIDARMGNTEKHIRSKKSDISRIIRSLSSSTGTERDQAQPHQDVVHHERSNAMHVENMDTTVQLAQRRTYHL